jgi:cephalosporin hydroxylase
MTETKSIPLPNQRRFWQKVRFRIARNSVLGKPYLGGEKLFKELMFQLDKAGVTPKYKHFNQCQSFDDFYEFALQNFGMIQFKPEISGFMALAAQASPQYICEIGTARGGTSFLFGQSLPSTKHMISVDLMVKNKNKLSLYVKPARQISFVDGSSYDLATIDRVENILAGNQLDLLFIDGDHTYEGVTKDFLGYRHLVKSGGIIGFHDIVPDYTTRYGKKTYSDSGGVPILWDRLKQLYSEHHEFIEDRNQDGLGIGAIVYDANVQVPADLL